MGYEQTLPGYSGQVLQGALTVPWDNWEWWCPGRGTVQSAGDCASSRPGSHSDHQFTPTLCHLQASLFMLLPQTEDRWFSS